MNLWNLITRGRVSRVTENTANQNLAVELQDEQVRQVELIEPYGLTVGVPVGSELVMFSVGGNEEHALALQVTKKTTRPKDVVEGDVCLYRENGGKIHLKENEITFTFGDHVLTMNEDGIYSNKEAVFNEDITSNADVVASGISLTGHQHQETNNVTSAPL